jgi:hypothetical protein
MTKKPKILVLLRPSLSVDLFSPESDQVLHTLGELVFHDTETNLEWARQADYNRPDQQMSSRVSIAGWHSVTHR